VASIRHIASYDYPGFLVAEKAAAPAIVSSSQQRVDMFRDLLVIADAHLGTKEGDTERMVRFVSSLNPLSNDLLFLGDLFQIWAGPVRYHTPPVTHLLSRLAQFRREEGRVYLVVGNRDLFLPELSPEDTSRTLPFDAIAPEYLDIKVGEQTVMAFHGDTVNRQDSRYLRWRRLVRDPRLERLFGFLPSCWIRRLMFNLEGQLKTTNATFRRHFPESEWQAFTHRIHRLQAPDMLLTGHFHPDILLMDTSTPTLSLVLPDWQRSQSYLMISPGLGYRLCRYTG
jgi:UDP-2,3-diacylglucosamine hydrolase